MFKYIKKDNHIYEVEIKDNFVFWKEEKDGITFELRISIDGAKENYRCADTVEELIDVYVADGKNNFGKNLIIEKWNSHHKVIVWSSDMFYELEELPKYFKNIRCGIFTDTGIIYVGDMNDEGGIKLR